MDEDNLEIKNKVNDETANDLVNKPKEELAKQIKNAVKIFADSADNLKIVSQFKMGKKYWDQNVILKKKEICFNIF